MARVEDARSLWAFITTPRFLYFLALWGAFLMMGVQVAIIGPSLMELCKQTGSSLSGLVYIFSGRSLGFFCGSLIGGDLVDRYKTFGTTILFLALSIAMSMMALIPLVPHVSLLVLVFVVQGVSLGTVDNLGQVLLMRVMDDGLKDTVQPYMQALHAAFGVGGLLAPLILSPFLDGGVFIVPTDDDSSPASAGGAVVSSTSYHYAYWVVCLLTLPICMALSTHMRREVLQRQGSIADCSAAPALPLTNLSNSDADCTVDMDSALCDEERDIELLPAASAAATAVSSSGGVDWSKWRMVVLLGAFLFLYIGCESGFAAYISAYSINMPMHFTTQQGAYLTAVFWSCFAAGRLAGIPISLRFTPTTMIFTDLCGAVLSVSALIMWHESGAVLWGCVATYGLSVASLYPSAINYAAAQFQVTGRVYSCLMVCATMGEAIVTLLMGLSFASPTGPLGLMLLTCTAAGSAIIIFAVVVAVVAPMRARARIQTPVEAAAWAKEGRREEKQRRVKNRQRESGPLLGGLGLLTGSALGD